MPSAIFVPDDAVSPATQIHVSAMVAATDEKQCYDVTKPGSFVNKVFGRTLILLTWNQALSFIPNYGTAVAFRRFFELCFISLPRSYEHWSHPQQPVQLRQP